MRTIGRVHPGAICVLVVAHPFLSADLRAYRYLVAVLISVPTTIVPLVCASPGARTPFRLLLIAMTVPAVGIGLTALGGPELRASVESVITVAHGPLLAAAIALVTPLVMIRVGRLGADKLISRADAGMYRAKESARRAVASA